MKTDTRILALLGMAPALFSFGETNSDAADKQQRPNILFCIADDASFYHFSKAGCPWISTPNFDRVANEGIFFERCYTPNAKSAPSRAILLTGCYSWQLGEAGNHVGYFPEDIKVFTEVLSEAGYDVAFTGKSWAPGNPGMKDGKPRELTGRPYNDLKVTPPTKGINNCDYAGNFKEFLKDADEDTPWFFWFGCKEPHRKYEYGSGIRLGGRSTSEVKEIPAFWPQNDIVRTDLLDYGFEIEYFDNQIGIMLDELEKKGMLENTLIVVTADNGMPFPRCKANDYEYANHMPCAMMWADGIKNPGRTVDSYVSFIDMAPTFMDLAGVKGEDYGMNKISGKSLKSFFEENTPKKELSRRENIVLGRERHDYGRPGNEGYPIRAIISGDYLYIWNLKPERMPAGNPETGYLDVDGSPTKTFMLAQGRKGEDMDIWNLSFGYRPEKELYNIKDDPYCMKNLAGEESMQPIIKELSARLMKELHKTHDPRIEGGGEAFDSYRFDSPDKWNFYERVVSGEIKEPWKKTGWVTPTDYEQHPSNLKK